MIAVRGMTQLASGAGSTETKPTQESIADAVKRSKNVWCPTLPNKALTWYNVTQSTPLAARDIPRRAVAPRELRR